MFPLARTPPPAGPYRYEATAYTLLIVIGIRMKRGQGEAVKTLWGSPAKQTRKERLAYKVRQRPSA